MPGYDRCPVKVRIRVGGLISAARLPVCKSTSSTGQGSAGADASAAANLSDDSLTRQRKLRKEQEKQQHIHLIISRHGHKCQSLACSFTATASSGLLPLPGPSHTIAPSHSKFRFWIDYQVLSSPASAALAEKALLMLGGVKTGGPPKLDPLTAAEVKIKDYGYMHMEAWDLLLSITAKAMLAAEILRPGQVTISNLAFIILHLMHLLQSLNMGEASAFGFHTLTLHVSALVTECGRRSPDQQCQFHTLTL